MSDPVIIHPYNSEWPAQFEAIAGPIRAALGELALSVQHIGSTSVPGLAAKPIIDLVIVMSSRLHLTEVIAKLAELGYAHAGDQGIPGREVFKKPAQVRHHLYACAVDAVPLHEHLLFRDYLRTYPAEAAAYGELKTKLAEQYGEDRDGYTEAKTEFVRGVLAKAVFETRMEEFGLTNRKATWPTLEFWATVLTTFMKKSTGELIYTEDCYTILAYSLENAEERLETKISVLPRRFTNTSGEEIDILEIAILNVGELRTFPVGAPYKSEFIRDPGSHRMRNSFSFDEDFRMRSAIDGRPNTFNKERTND